MSKKEQEIVIGTAQSIDAAGAVRAITVMISERDGAWAVWIDNGGTRLSPAFGLKTRTEAERTAQDYLSRLANDNEQRIATAVKIAAEHLGYDEYAARALLQRMTRESVGLRRGWIINRVGVPDLTLPKCDSEVQAAFAIQKLLSPQPLP